MRNLKEYADVTLKDAIENNMLYKYIVGEGKYEVPINNGYAMEHSTYHVVESLHRYKNNNPDSDIDKKYYETMKNSFDGPANPDIITLINTLYIELGYESKTKDNFEVDNTDLLNRCKQHLLINKNKYNGIWKTIEQFNYGMNEEHNKTIL